MSTGTLTALCEQVRPELACLGDVGTPLIEVLVIEVLGAVERDGAGCDPLRQGKNAAA